MAHVIDTSAIGYQLKRVYGDKITDLFARHTMTYNLFNKSNRKASYKPGGEGFYFALRQGDLESVGARGQGHKLPYPGDPDGVQGYISPKLIYGVLKLSGLAVEAGKSNVMAFANVQGDAVANVYKSLVNDLNRQCHGDGTGLLGTLSAAASHDADGTFSAAFDNDRGVRYMKKGMVVDFYESTAIDTNSVACMIKSINPNTQVVTFYGNGYSGHSYRANHPITTGASSDGSIASGAYCVRYGSRATTHVATTTYEIMGLLGMYDDATRLSSFEGVTVSDGNDTEFRANRLTNSSVNRELSIDLMLAGMDMTAARSGEQVDIIRMGLGQRRKYFGLLAPDVRYAPGKFLGGYETLDFAQNARVKIIVDPHTQPNRLFLEPSDTIKKYELTPIGWGGMDGQKMHWRELYDESYMFLRVYTNLGVEQRNALTAIEDLTEPESMPF